MKEMSYRENIKSNIAKYEIKSQRALKSIQAILEDARRIANALPEDLLAPTRGYKYRFSTQLKLNKIEALFEAAEKVDRCIATLEKRLSLQPVVEVGGIVPPRDLRQPLIDGAVQELQAIKATAVKTVKQRKEEDPDTFVLSKAIDKIISSVLGKEICFFSKPTSQRVIENKIAALKKEARSFNK